MDLLRDAWNALFTEAPAPPIWVAASALALGIAFVAVPALWRPARHVVTLVHEVGHAVIGVLTGRKLNGIKLHSDTSGVTTTSGVSWGLSGMLTTMAGYPAGAAAGAILALAVFTGRAYIATGISVLILAILLLFTRNLWGVVITVASGAALLLLLTKASPLILQFALLGLAVFLFAGSIQTLLEERHRRRGGLDGSDISNLAARTTIPATIWWGIEIALCATWGAAAAYLIFA